MLSGTRRRDAACSCCGAGPGRRDLGLQDGPLSNDYRSPSTTVPTAWTGLYGRVAAYPSAWDFFRIADHTGVGRLGQHCGVYGGLFQGVLCQHKLPRTGLRGSQERCTSTGNQLCCQVGSPEVGVARSYPSADRFFRGSSQIRAALRCFLSRTGDEKPHRNAKYAYLCATRCGQIPPSGRHINSLLVEPVGQSSEPFGQPEIPMTNKTLTESKTATIIPSELQTRCNYNSFAIAGRSVARKGVWEWAWRAPSGAFHPPR